jgi:hypothetical protein
MLNGHYSPGPFTIQPSICFFRPFRVISKAIMHTSKCFSAVVMIALMTGAAAAAEFSSVEERMSQQEFHAAGLDKLSPEELKNLDEWLRTHQAATTKLVGPSGAPVFYTNKEEKVAVESRIAGKFRGWYGKSTFTLENGQEWTQAESGQINVGPYDHPKVKIKPMLVGAWLMYVEPCGCSVRVERAK